MWLILRRIARSLILITPHNSIIYSASLALSDGVKSRVYGRNFTHVQTLQIPLEPIEVEMLESEWKWALKAPGRLPEVKWKRQKKRNIKNSLSKLLSASLRLFFYGFSSRCQQDTHMNSRYRILFAIQSIWRNCIFFPLLFTQKRLIWKSRRDQVDESEFISTARALLNDPRSGARRTFSSEFLNKKKLHEIGRNCKKHVSNNNMELELSNQYQSIEQWERGGRFGFEIIFQILWRWVLCVLRDRLSRIESGLRAATKSAQIRFNLIESDFLESDRKETRIYQW